MGHDSRVVRTRPHNKCHGERGRNWVFTPRTVLLICIKTAVTGARATQSLLPVTRCRLLALGCPWAQAVAFTSVRRWRTGLTFVTEIRGWNKRSFYPPISRRREHETLNRSCFNPLSPNDALKHHFTSLKTDLIVQSLRFLERKFPWNWFTKTWQFSVIFKSYQIIFMHYKSRIATAIRWNIFI